MNGFVSLKVAAEAKNQGVSKETAFAVDPRKIEVEPGFNRPISADHVEQMKTSIRNGATIPPIYVRVDAGRIIMVDGEHRLRAVLALIDEGIDIKSMSAIQFRGNDAERVAHLITSSQGNGLTPLDAGFQYAKLERFGWTRRDIANRVGRSVSHVDDCITLSQANSDVHRSIRAGEVASTTATKIVKKHGERAGQVIADGVVRAKANGKTRVTDATVETKTKNKSIKGAEAAHRDGRKVTITFDTHDAAREFVGGLKI